MLSLVREWYIDGSRSGIFSVPRTVNLSIFVVFLYLDHYYPVHVEEVRFEGRRDSKTEWEGSEGDLSTYRW